MSDFDGGNIRVLLGNERENEQTLIEEIQYRQEELLRCQGKILAYEELLKNIYGEEYTHFMGDSVFDSRDNSIEIKAFSKERAPRTTKREMERRKDTVRRVFSIHGDLSAKELQPLVEEELGYEMATHSLRAVLRKSSKDFIQRGEHGIWGLSGSSPRQSSSFTEEDSSDATSDTE